MARADKNSFFKFVKTRYILLIFTIFAVVLLAVFFSRSNFLSSEQPIFPPGVRYVQDEIIIKYKNGQSPEELKFQGKQTDREKLLLSLAQVGALSQKKLYQDEAGGLGSYYILTLKYKSNIPEVYESLKKIPEIDTSTPNYILRIQDVPNDPYFPQMWNLKKNNLENAWNTTHTNGVLVGVIDTGTDYNHEDLRGIVVKGRNFVNNNNDPMDDQGHGTHVAGILGAVTNNSLGVSGVSWGAKILSLKACDSEGNCKTSDVSRAIKYAVERGVKFINISIAGPGSCRGTYSDVLQYAKEKGAVIISAAGNGQNGTGDGVSVDSQIPASCNNVLAVGSITAKDNSSSFSNYGSKVRVSAPGGQSPCDMSSCILSTSLGNKYSLRSGTSMAAPQVTGLAALIFSNNPSLDSEKVISCIIRGADIIKTRKPVGPKLNAQKSLKLCSSPKENISTPTPVLKPFSISGIVFIDKNNNKKLDSEEIPFGGAQVILSGGASQSVVSNPAGKYAFLDLEKSLYTLTLTINGKSVGDAVDVVLSNTIPAIYLDLPVPASFSSTQTPQKTASKCYLDPECLTEQRSFQVCSFKCN